MNASKRRQAYLMLGIGSFIVVAIVAANLALRSKEKPNSLGCLKNSNRSTVIVLDQTDGLKTQTQEEIFRRIQNILENDMAVGERVSVFFVNELSEKNLKPQFEHCKPPETGNDLYQNRKAIVKRKEIEFDEPLRAALTFSVGQSSQSPIAEALSDLSASTYLHASERNRLIVFSDLVQNTNSANMYSCTAGSQLIQAYSGARVGAIQRPSFNNLEVGLHIVPRNLSAGTVKCRNLFWNWFFGDNRGAKAQVVTQQLP